MRNHKSNSQIPSDPWSGIRRNTNPQKSAGASLNVPKTTMTAKYKVMKMVGIERASYKSLFSLTAGIVLVMIVMQTMGYLASAENNSGDILGAATTAYSDLNFATSDLKAQKFSDAADLFESARKNLEVAANNLNQYWLLTKFVPQAKSADRLLEGAQYLAEAGQKLSSAMGVFNELKVSSKGVETTNFAQILSNSKQTLVESLDLIEKAQAQFSQVENLPQPYQQNVDNAKKQIAVLSGLLKNMIQLEDLYSAFFGNLTKTYLIIFQNSDEMRATGGFIGTYGVLKITDGAIKKLQIESIYNLDGSIYDQIAAPGPLQPDIKKWGIRDANWFADFPTSAKKLLQFFEKGRETADGVLAFTPQFFANLLELTGPIEMPDYNVTLTVDNFQEIVQLKTSVEYDKQLNQPKKFLADFAPAFLDRLKNLTKEEWLAMLQIINDNLNAKNILIYSADANVQDKIINAGVAGEIAKTESDYLAIINSNLGGTKTDLKVKQSVAIESKLRDSGEIVNTLRITRANLSEQPNKDFMRVLVPEGSKLISAKGFDDLPQFSSVAEGFESDSDLTAWDKAQSFEGNVYARTEAGKTEFSGWLQTSAITAKTVTLTYLLPFKLDLNALSSSAPFSLLFQKQPGVNTTDIKGTWIFEGLKTVWTSDNVERSLNRADFESLGKSDEYWSMLITK